MLDLQLISLPRVRDTSPCNREAIGSLSESRRTAGDDMIPTHERPIVDHSYSGNVNLFGVESMHYI